MKRISGGFTVIEVLIGIALFGFVIPVIIFAVVSLGDLNSRSGDLTRANIIAERKLEELRSAGYNALNIETVSFTDELDSFGSPKSATYTVSSPTAGIKNVDIAISYTEKGSGERNLTFRTRITELGVAQ